jgi:hypothetical protein
MADQQNTSEPAQQFTYPSPAHWCLSGDAGSLALDRCVEMCVAVGLSVSFIRPGAYRIAGKMEAIQIAAEWMTFSKLAPIKFNVERPPEGLRLRFEVKPDRPPPRVAKVHGLEQPERPVARAIDAGLSVQCVGLSHYRITGPTRCHVAWMASLLEVPTARALEIMGLTAAQAAAEDAAAALPPINVVLPVRETVSQITRDARGDISKVKQTERSVKA